MTKSNTLYNIRIFKNEKLKLAHVAINLVNARTASLASRYGKMVWAIKSGNDVAFSTGHFNDGFLFMLANSNRDDWNEEIVLENLTREDAGVHKKELSENLVDAGYTINSMSSSGCSPHGDEIIPKYINRMMINPSTLTRKKFRAFCEKCTVGMNIDVKSFDMILNKCYKRIIYTKDDSMSKYDVWKEYQNIKN